jgi:hypothetical protein
VYIYVRHGGGPCRPIGDVQTDVHIVPVDSDSPIRNLLKVQTVRRALVLYRGNYSAPGHHLFNNLADMALW